MYEIAKSLSVRAILSLRHYLSWIELSEINYTAEGTGNEEMVINKGK